MNKNFLQSNEILFVFCHIHAFLVQLIAGLFRVTVMFLFFSYSERQREGLQRKPHSSVVELVGTNERGVGEKGSTAGANRLET